MDFCSFWKMLRNLCIAGYCFLYTSAAQAQYYGQGYAAEPEGPSAVQKILTGPFATLIMVLVGTAGVFNLFFNTGKGETSDKKHIIGMVCMILVILLVSYRCSLWNDPNAR